MMVEFSVFAAFLLLAILFRRALALPPRWSLGLALVTTIVGLPWLVGLVAPFAGSWLALVLAVGVVLAGAAAIAGFAVGGRSPHRGSAWPEDWWQ